MNTEKLEKLKKSLDNKFIPDNMKDKIRAEIKKLEADIKTDETITATEVKEEVKEIEKKVEKALEVAEEKEEQAEAKAEEKKEKAPRKAREKKATQSETKTPKVEPKSTAKKKSVFSIAKEIRKDNESWEDAKERARKMMKSETTETKKKTRTETDKLLAMVRRNKEYKKLAGTSNLPKDASRRALPRGKRVSANGNVYYENRANRVDVGGFKNAYLENGGGVDGIIELKPLELIPLSTQLNRLSGYNWTSGDWESEDGGKPSTMPNSVIVNVHTKQKFRLSPIKIEEKYISNSNKPLYAKQQYRIVKYSEDGQIIEYSFGWHDTREDAVQELKEMFGSYADKGVYVETLDEEIDLTDDGNPRVIKTQQGGNKSFGERREMHGASPEALAFDNGGKVGRYSILGEVDGEQPVLYATTDDKERIKPLVNMAEIDLYELTGKNHRIFVTDEVTDDEVYHYGNGGRTRERRYVNHSQDYEVRYSKDKTHRRGYGYAGGGVVLDNVKIEVYKSFHGLKAENYFDDVNGYDWNVVTMKRHTGELVSSARGGKANKSEGNVEFFTFDYNSPNIKLISSRPSRVTEKVIEIQHSQALQLFKEKMEQGNFADGGGVGQKKYNIKFNVGKAKYVINYHDGVKKHKDGSDFYDMEIFKTKPMFDEFQRKLIREGYKYTYAEGGTIIGTPETPLARGLDIDYTGLVGETGGMSAGEMFAEGGSIENQYEGKTAKEVWNIWTLDQREHFLADHYDVLMGKDLGSKNKKFEDLAFITQMQLELHISQGQYAMGGSLGNHGLKQGDEIIKTMSGGVQKVKTKSGDIVYVNLANGYRGDTPPLPFSKGGSLTNERRHVNKAQDYEVRYAKNKPNRAGYKGKRSFDDGGYMTDPNFGDFQNGVYAEKGAKVDNQFSYMMLSRLQMDCDYYLGYGNRNEKVLWAGNVDDHIAEMKKLWNSLPKNEKPEWLTMEDILDYEKKMKIDNYANGGKIQSKIQKKVDEVNSLIEKAIDKDGDPIMVVDKSGTWEEPMQYKPIVYKNGRLYFEYYEPYSGKTQKEVVNKSNIEFDGYPMLLDIAKMYRSALKEKGVSFGGGGSTEVGYFKNEINNDYISEINKYFNKWNSIKTEKDSENFKKIKPPMFGTYKNVTILEQISKFENQDVPFGANQVLRNDFKKEVSKIIDNFTNKKSYGKGGSTKRGGAMQLAKQIRKDGESWQSALKRANEQMRNK